MWLDEAKNLGVPYVHFKSTTGDLLKPTSGIL
jgi:hypothetical protein